MKRLRAMALASSMCASLLVVAPRTEVGVAAVGNWSPAGNMVIGRQSQTATLLASGKVLVAGGFHFAGNAGFLLALAELYDPATNTWAATGSMAAARENFAATVLNDGRVLVVGNGAGLGGCMRGAGGTVPVAPPELYNPGLGTWAAAGTMINADRGFPTATTLADGKVLVAGGFDSSTLSVLATAELFNPANGGWLPTGSMNTARAGQTAELLADGRVFVQGGDYPTTAPEIYNPATGLWSIAAAPPTVYRGRTSAVLGDGSVLLAGGQDSVGVTIPFADRYLPSTNSWSPAGSLNVARWGHTETRLADGRALVTGGCGTGGVTLASSETYDPVSGGWTATGSMATPRFHFTSTLLGDGRVLVAGGNDGTTLDSLTSAEIFAAPAPSLAVEVLPAVSNGAYGGYITAATIQNTGTADASIQIAYYDQNGAHVGTGDSMSLPVNGSWTVRQDNGHSFPSSGGDAVQAGSAVIYSNQPVAAFVNEFPPANAGDATSYTGVQVANGVGATLYAPTIVNNAYGGYTTGIGLLNEGATSTTVTITYRNGSGVAVAVQTVTGLAAHAYLGLYSGDAALALPTGFAGTATITSSPAQPLGAVVNEVGPGGQFSSFDAVPVGSTTLDAPVALNCAFGCYYTGMGIQNTSATAGTVTITYYDSAGAPTVKNFNIPANGSLGVYQGSASDGPAVGAYTATISSSVAVAAIVNEVAPVSGTALQSTSYNTFNAGSSSVHLPLVENVGGNPWDTGEGIMNTGTASTTVTVTYYDTVTGAAVGTPDTQTLAPHAFWGLFQPNGGLPTGTRATAVVTTSSGGQVAVICNESNPTTFMSYDGQ